MMKAFQQWLNNGRGYLDYRHKSGKLYACSVCNSYKSPTEYSTTFHVGKTDKSCTSEWDMVYPSQVVCLKTEFEKCQVNCSMWYFFYNHKRCQETPVATHSRRSQCFA